MCGHSLVVRTPRCGRGNPGSIPGDRFCAPPPPPAAGKKGCNTQGSHVITHRSTNWACRCLTSQIGRDGVLSPEYGRIRQEGKGDATVALALGAASPEATKVDCTRHRGCDRLCAQQAHVSFRTYLIGVWPDHEGSRHTNGPCIALRLERW